MVPTIALYHSGVGAVLSSVSFFIPSYVRFLFFFSYLILVLGVATMPTNSPVFKFHFRQHVTTLIVLMLPPFSVSVCS